MPVDELNLPDRIDADRFRTASRDELPTFLGLGLPKCGTTWMHAILSEHPEIDMPPYPLFPSKKEFNFWCEYRNVLDTEAYLGAFAACTAKARGEFSVMYCDDNRYMRWIRACLPDVKVIVGFRDPALAYHSAYLHSLRGGAESVPFGQWLEGYIAEYGPIYDYNRIWDCLRATFPEEQVFTYFYEELVREPEAIVRALFAFLGVDPDYRPEALDRQFNARYEYRSRKLYLATVEVLFRLYGKVRARKMVSDPHIRPWWVNLALRANQKIDNGHEMTAEERAAAIAQTAQYWDRFAKAFGKDEAWGLQWRDSAEAGTLTRAHRP